MEKTISLEGWYYAIIIDRWICEISNMSGEEFYKLQILSKVQSPSYLLK